MRVTLEKAKRTIRNGQFRHKAALVPKTQDEHRRNKIHNTEN
jgi:hypothetical protein